MENDDDDPTEDESENHENTNEEDSSDTEHHVYSGLREAQSQKQYTQSILEQIQASKM